MRLESKDLSFLLTLSAEFKLFADTISYKLALRSRALAFCCDCQLRADPEKQTLSISIRRSDKSWFQGSESKLFAETVAYKLVLRSKILAFCRDCHLEVGPENQDLSFWLGLSAKSLFREAKS